MLSEIHSTDEILKVYKLGETPPPSQNLQLNFTVKKTMKIKTFLKSHFFFFLSYCPKKN